MSQRNVLLLVLVSIVAIFGGLMAYDMSVNHRLEKDKKDNWQWKDSWSNNQNKVDPELKPDDQQEETIEETPKSQIAALTYVEAVKKSGELGMPVMILFSAEWCNWCVKMHSETMTDENVKAIMINYILLNVNTDNDKETTKKFGITRLPSYVITNSNEEKLKSGNGFQSADSFHDWLNDSNMFNQPKIETTPPKEEDEGIKKERKKRRN